MVEARLQKSHVSATRERHQRSNAIVNNTYCPQRSFTQESIDVRAHSLIKQAHFPILAVGVQEITGTQMEMLLSISYVCKLKEGIVSGACCVWRESVLFAKRPFFRRPSASPNLNTILQSLHLLNEIHFDASPHC